MDNPKSPFATLSPERVASIKNLELRARLIVEGTIAGLHQSPYHGFSSEFLEYRPYLPGESTRRIDWRKFAKTDKTVVRLFEDETNLFATILIDKSASMKFSSADFMNKYDYAKTLAASLALLLIRQRDAVGLCAFDESSSCRIPPHSTGVQLKTIMAALDRMRPSGSTRCGAALSQLAMTTAKRGLCIVLSDLFDEPEDIIRGLRYLRFKKQDVILLRIVDPLELKFFHTATLKVRDLETGERLTLDPLIAERFFSEGVMGHHDRVNRACKDMRIDYEMISTDEFFHKALMRILGKRRRMS
jgi:uncharacterized protein (DUF58 family)